MKISIGRDRKDLGEYEWEDVHTGLKAGLFMASDFAWYPGMTEWLPVAEVLKNLDFLARRNVEPPLMPGEAATLRQVRRLTLAGILIPDNLTNRRASELIRTLPAPFSGLTNGQLVRLKNRGYDPRSMTLRQCEKVLKGRASK